MDRIGKKLVDNFGRGAGNGIDDYYHPLLQCHLAQMGSQSQQNGIVLGYGKEAYDYIVKRIRGMKHGDIITDSSKDLRNNEYGSINGARNPDKPCVELLSHLRTRNMQRKNFY